MTLHLPCYGLPIFPRYLALSDLVHLVANEHDGDTLAILDSHDLRLELVDTLKGSALRDAVDNEESVSFAVQHIKASLDTCASNVEHVCQLTVSIDHGAQCTPLMTTG